MDDKKVYWKYELRKVYVIGVLNFIIDDNPEHTEVVTHAKLRYDEYENELYSDKLEFINIEMPTVPKHCARRFSNDFSISPKFQSTNPTSYLPTVIV